MKSALLDTNTDTLTLMYKMYWMLRALEGQIGHGAVSAYQLLESIRRDIDNVLDEVDTQLWSGTSVYPE